ncbi:hypothetical protein [Lactobacillus terrae]|uniref:hypothetical protein n=1 Tax=Lactobacillus terrae TaxID=2269374 RepID=UPI000C1B6A91|nr:hypothetical protein [Lactobacillus terrae]
MDWKSILPSLIALASGYIGAMFQFRGITRGSDIDLSQDVKDSLMKLQELNADFIETSAKLTEATVALNAANKRIDQLVSDNEKLSKQVTDLTDAINYMRTKEN